MKLARRVERRTRRDWVEAFRLTYVFGRELAEACGRSPKYTAAKLAAAGVDAVAGPGVDTCRQLVYERTVAEAALGLLSNVVVSHASAGAVA